MLWQEVPRYSEQKIILFWNYSQLIPTPVCVLLYLGRKNKNDNSNCLALAAVDAIMLFCLFALPSTLVSVKEKLFCDRKK